MIGTLGNVARTVFCSRLSPCGVYWECTSNITTCTNPLLFGRTDILQAEPLKKKRRIDPAILRHQQERRRKKIEKQIRMLQKFEKQLKPIYENQVPYKLIDERESRSRRLPPPSQQEVERRMLLEKQWTSYKNKQNSKDMETLSSILFSQQNALDELKAESIELYNEALQIDPYLVPYTAVGPVDTPPIDNYDSPDGDYINVTRKFEGEE